MAVKKFLQIVEVEWVDSCGWNRWAPREKHASEACPSNCVSTGYVLKSDRKSLTIHQSSSGEGNVDSSLSIPRGCIKRVRKVGRSRFYFKEDS